MYSSVKRAAKTEESLRPFTAFASRGSSQDSDSLEKHVGLLYRATRLLEAACVHVCPHSHTYIVAV